MGVRVAHLTLVYRVRTYVIGVDVFPDLAVTDELGTYVDSLIAGDNFSSSVGRDILEPEPGYSEFFE